MADFPKRSFRTSCGEVPLWAPFDRHVPAKPVLLVIRGAFAALDDWTVMVDAFSQADVVQAHLPGMHSPFHQPGGIAGFGRAFDEVIDQAFAGRRVVVLGLSMGGLVAMTLRSSAVTQVIACDPPLSTAGLWPLIPELQAKLADSAVGAELRSWITDLFGVSAAGVENVDYRPLLDGLTVRTDIIIAALPLEPERDLPVQPGFMSADDRAFVRRHPKVRVLIAPNTGHNVPRHAPWVMTAVVNRALYETASAS
jgi:pimeloyl-ACP methyl ester carboxylesterase